MPTTNAAFKAWPRIVSIKPLGVCRVIDLQTSEKTFIAEGLVSHNSTYITARGYKIVSQERGAKGFILAHLDKATTNLFRMVKRYYDLSPSELRPSSKYNNGYELTFDRLDSGYGVATAGRKDVGRSDTLRFCHGSEVAYWGPKTDDILAGIGQAVPLLPGTEVFLESTSAGMGNPFHKLCQDALAGKGYYRLVFVPWYIQTEYRMKAPAEWKPSGDDLAYGDGYKLDREQLYWRRMKIDSDFRGDEVAFKREYPSSIDEAFEAKDAQSFIKSLEVRRARKYRVEGDLVGPVMIGVDPAWHGNARSVIMARQGRKAWLLDVIRGDDTMQTAGRVKKWLDLFPGYGACNIDSIGIGAGVYDRLREMGYWVTPLNVGKPAVLEDQFFDTRAELWDALRTWLRGEPQVEIPDLDELQVDLLAPNIDHDSRNRLRIESKDSMKSRGVKSPDMADALMMTFYGQPSANASSGRIQRKPVNWRAR